MRGRMLAVLMLGLALGFALALGLSQTEKPARAAQPPGRMPRYEYQVVRFVRPGQENQAAMLNELGAAGWEYVGLTHISTQAPAISYVAFRRRTR